MSDLPPELLASARAQGGVFLTGQAVAAGLSYAALGRAVRTRRIVRLRRGAYALVEPGEQAPSAEDAHRRLARACLLTLRPPVWVSHQSAALLHGLTLYRTDLSTVHVTRPGRVSSRVEAGIDHHCGELPETQRVSVDGIPVVSVARAVVDVARTHAFDQGVVVADSALRAGLAPARLWDVLALCRDWPGAGLASRVVAFADGRAESPGESLARCLLSRAGLAPDTLQLHLPVGPYGVRADLAWRRHRVVLEFDGKVKYGRAMAPGADPAEAAWRERQRELAIERLGWVVARVTWAEVVGSPWVVVRRVQEAMDLAVQRRLVPAAV